MQPNRVDLPTRNYIYFYIPTTKPPPTLRYHSRHAQRVIILNFSQEQNTILDVLFVELKNLVALQYIPIFVFKLFSKRSKYSVLASALVTVTPFTSLSFPEAHAGIMVDTYEQLLYGDIAEGKGIFAPGKTNIQIYDTDGKLRGSIPYSVDPQGIADEFFLTLIHPQFGVSAYHVGYTTDITFGNTKILVRNDGTLFEESKAVKAFNGNSIDDTKEWSRLLSGNKKQWRAVFPAFFTCSS